MVSVGTTKSGGVVYHESSISSTPTSNTTSSSTSSPITTTSSTSSIPAGVTSGAISSTPINYSQMVSKPVDYSQAVSKPGVSNPIQNFSSSQSSISPASSSSLSTSGVSTPTTSQQSQPIQLQPGQVPYRTDTAIPSLDLSPLGKGYYNVDKLVEGSPQIQYGDRTYNYSTGRIQKFIPGEGSAYYQGQRGNWIETNEKITSKPSWYAKSQEQEVARQTALNLGIEKSQSTISSSKQQNFQGSKIMSESALSYSGAYSAIDLNKGLRGEGESRMFRGGFSAYNPQTGQRGEGYSETIGGKSVYTTSFTSNEIKQQKSLLDIPINRIQNIFTLFHTTPERVGQTIVATATTIPFTNIGLVSQPISSGDKFEGVSLGLVRGATTGAMFEAAMVLGETTSLLRGGVQGLQTFKKAETLGGLTLGGIYTAEKVGQASTLIQQKKYEQLGELGVMTGAEIIGFGMGSGIVKSEFTKPSSFLKEGKFTSSLTGEVIDVNLEISKGGVSIPETWNRIMPNQITKFTDINEPSLLIKGTQVIGGRETPFDVVQSARGDVIKSYIQDEMLYRLSGNINSNLVKMEKFQLGETKDYTGSRLIAEKVVKTKGVGFSPEVIGLGRTELPLQVKESLIPTGEIDKSALTLISGSREELVIGGRVGKQNLVGQGIFDIAVERTARAPPEKGVFSTSVVKELTTGNLKVQPSKTSNLLYSIEQPYTSPRELNVGELTTPGSIESIGMKEKVLKETPLILNVESGMFEKAKTVERTSKISTVPEVSVSDVKASKLSFTLDVNEPVRSNWYNLFEKTSIGKQGVLQTSIFERPEIVLETGKATVSKPTIQDGLNIPERISLGFETPTEISKPFTINQGKAQSGLTQNLILGTSETIKWYEQTPAISTSTQNLIGTTSIQNFNQTNQQSQAQTQALATTETGISGGDFSFNIQPPTMPIYPPRLPGFDLLPTNRRLLNSEVKTRSRKRKYIPSALAIVLGSTIKGKEPKGYFSGQEFRPMIILKTSNKKRR